MCDALEEDASSPTSTAISGSPSQKLSGASPGQNERKRDKEAQWMSAIGKDDARSDLETLIPKRKNAISDATPISSNSRSTRKGRDDHPSRRGRDAGRSYSKLSRIPESKPSSSRRSKSSRQDSKHEKHSKRGRPHAHMMSDSGNTSESTGEVLTAQPRAVSPSLLSVMSISTNFTNRSNDSNSTITQRSHDKETARKEPIGDSESPTGDVPSVKDQPSAKSDSPLLDQVSATISSTKMGRHPSRYLPMQATVSDDVNSPEASSDGVDPVFETRSTSPSVTSEAPETPSSRSTDPSPSINRLPSHVGHWTQSNNDDRGSIMAHSGRPNSGTSNPRNDAQTFVDAEESHVEHQQYDEEHVRWDQKHHMNDVQAQEEILRDHLARYENSQRFLRQEYQVPETNMPLFREPAYHPLKAIEHTTTPLQEHTMRTTHQQSSGRPMFSTAPEPPDLTRTTLVGYELMASKLAEASSIIRPAYRKFEMLHHRILLHIQDEICELEETLRRLDELAAQMATKDERGASPPASRRADAYYGNRLHLHRTHLLGQIFVKLEQYHRALSAYSGVTKGFDRAGDDDIARYRAWVATNRPVHQVEAGFLRDSRDLVTLPQRGTGITTTTQPSIVLLAFIPSLPLVTFSMVPTFLGRVFFTAAIAAVSWLYISVTEWRTLLSDRQWAASIIAYLLLMTAISGVA